LRRVPSDPAVDATEVSALITRWQTGDETALTALMPLVYAELRKLARRYLRGERTGHTLQPTALVHEAWMRLNVESQPLRNRAHFFAIAANLMRQVLVDHARARGAQKRFGGAVRVELDPETPAAEAAPELLALDQALTALERVDARKARIVELRFFAGLSNAELARALSISEPTAVRRWRVARMWLRRELEAR